MCIQVNYSFAFCDSSRKEGKCSLAARIVGIALGAISLLLGVLILCGVPGLAQLGTTIGGLNCAGGILGGIISFCIKFEKHHTSSGTQADRTLDFSDITPENYEAHLNLDPSIDSEQARAGDFMITRSLNNQPGLEGKISCILGNGEKSLFELNLKIEGGNFCCEVHEGGSPISLAFDNLKEFFDYLLKGNFHQGERIKVLDHFNLRVKEGIARYRNPYKSEILA